MKNAPPVRHLNKAKVLVLAGQFPALNQPWMDTYLQQLDSAGIGFAILSKQWSRWPYNKKVDLLGLLDTRILVDDRPSSHVRVILTFLISRPAMVLKGFLAAWRLSRSEQTARSRVSTLIRGASMLCAVSKLSDLRVIHVHSLDMGFDVIPTSIVRSIPVVLTFHGLEPSGVRQVAESRRRSLFAHADRVLVNTRFARVHAIELGCPSEKIVVIPQGLPLEDFPFCPRKAPSSGEPLEILSVGRFHRDKGQGYSLLALARLRKKGFDARWHFAGVGPDLRRLESLARRLGVHQFVEFHEAVPADDLKALYRRCHLFVLASVSSATGVEHMETQGVVIQEAQASGCIPIATRTGGIPECITDGHDGLLVEERSHKAMANAILYLMANQEQWSTLQQNGRRTVEDRFSSGTIGRQVNAILQEVAGGSALNDIDSV
jgi:colanic acid/amylovoran biosynthesis glycosyltransferase